MDELLALLAELEIKSETAVSLLKTGKNAEENDKFVADANAIFDEIDATNKKIKAEKDQQMVMARMESLKKTYCT